MLHSEEGPAFAIVDIVQPGSPSSAAGVAGGDRVLRLGTLRLMAPQTRAVGSERLTESASARGGRQAGPVTVAELFQMLPGEVGRHENERMPVVVERGNRVLSFWLIPRRWHGRGLLGCHLTPIQEE